MDRTRKQLGRAACRLWRGVAVTGLALGAASCAGARPEPGPLPIRGLPPTPYAAIPAEAGLFPPPPPPSSQSPTTVEVETRTIPLRFKRPIVNGEPGQDYALLRFLEESLSDVGQLEYRSTENTVVITDLPANLRSVELVLDLLDFAGLPVPSNLGHVPYRVDEGTQIVPNVPPGRY